MIIPSALIIDDDARVHEVMTSLLQARGWQVVHAYNPDDGLAQALAHTFTVILLDLNLHASRDGWAVLAALPAATRAHTIIHSGYISRAEKATAMTAGAAGCLTKDYDEKTLDSLLAGLPQDSA